MRDATWRDTVAFLVKLSVVSILISAPVILLSALFELVGSK